MVCFAIMPFYFSKAYAEGIPEVLKELDQIQKTLNEQVIPQLDKCCNTNLGVPRTGQTISYAAGDDGDLQKEVAWPKPRFTDLGDGTVTDNLTGLIWTKNAQQIQGL